MTRRSYWFLVTFILLMAAGLRLWGIHALPPGPHYDEAANVLITRSIAFGGANHFPIVNSYQGREALYYYLNAPLFHLISDGRFTLQLSNAFMNLMTIAATMALGRAMLRGRRGVVVGLVAGGLMALSFPLILLSRQAFRAPTLPLMQALALLCLWRGLNSGRRRWLVAGGGFAGAAVYTYMASRLFPVWLLLAGLLLIVLDAGHRWRRWRQGLVFFGTLTLVALPMAIFAVQNPAIFLGRLQEVTHPEQSVTLAESVVRHLRMFFIEGEQLLRYNLPGRPYFTWPEGWLLLVGLGVGLWRLLRPGRATERAAYGLVLLAPLMVIPSVISVGGFPPNHMRSIGMIPLVFVLIGVGGEMVVAHLYLFVGARHAVPLPDTISSIPKTTLITLAIITGTLLVANVYFTWAGRADLFYDTDADLAAAADWLPQHIDEDTRVYIAARDRQHPTVVIENLPDVTWLGTDTLFRPPPGQTGLIVFPRSAPPPAAWADWLEPYAMSDLPLAPDGRPAFEAFRLEANTPLPDLKTMPNTIENAALTLLGYRANPIFPNSSGEITLIWEVRQSPTASDLTPVLEIHDLGERLARAETPFRQTDAWQPGEVLIHRMNVTIPPATPPGMYPFRLTWVARTTETYQPYVTGTGQPFGLWREVGEVEVLKPGSFPDPTELDITNRADIKIAPGVNLLGWSALPASRRPGEWIDLSLYWQGMDADRADVERDLLLLSGDGEIALFDDRPFRYPPSQWAAGEVVREAVPWQLARNLENGDYTLVLRVGESLVELGTLEIVGLPRIYDLPSVSEQAEIALGESLQLYGYVIEADGDLRLQLVWQALASVETDYTVFIHVLDEDGNIIAQRDIMPMNNTYPTSLWAAGEYVLDEHTFTDLPSGNYGVRVGLYDQATSARLIRIDGSDFIDLRSIPVPCESCKPGE